MGSQQYVCLLEIYTVVNGRKSTDFLPDGRKKTKEPCRMADAQDNQGNLMRIFHRRLFFRLLSYSGNGGNAPANSIIIRQIRTASLPGNPSTIRHVVFSVKPWISGGDWPISASHGKPTV